MSRFLTTLDVRMLPEMDDQNWMLISPLIYFSDRLGDYIRVPENFITNFVSFQPLKNIGQRAATVHDYLYDCQDFPRELADDILREALECVGITEGLANSMWLAVRAFGQEFRKDPHYTFFDQQGKEAT